MNSTYPDTDLPFQVVRVAEPDWKLFFFTLALKVRDIKEGYTSTTAIAPRIAQAVAYIEQVTETANSRPRWLASDDNPLDKVHYKEGEG